MNVGYAYIIWLVLCWVVCRQKNSITLGISSSVALVSPDSCLSILVSSDATSLIREVCPGNISDSPGNHEGLATPLSCYQCLSSSMRGSFQTF